ncbi:hypothetical protein ASPZODRAFT_106589 [Penicilliopsis zonata CBS 506.65]|uniref:Uncharacterized protein n=1 Tax=Penicilliopsis zonata CBS 506.65 TaxID=1073090 RepID=A0A1L9SU63_9EURO|nr:hypothetical protein ASPZODRAFT_106589 [Penicilliopsis zonata CBS 506.65]OJJ50748.1 hypothetical protein ASPZODRAFT_106589 [Penicilliopsis zonata CBS 506.65]
MDSIAIQIKQLASSADETGRRYILDTLTELQWQVETPYDTLMRFKMMSGPLVIARIAADLGLFKILARSEQCLELDQIVQETGGAESMIRRLLRTMASFSLIEEVGVDRFTANAMTRLWAEPVHEAHLHVSFEMSIRLGGALPDFLAEHGYQDVTHRRDTVFQKAFQTDLLAFDYMATQPDLLKSFQQTMGIKRVVDWLSVFPFEAALGDWDNEVDRPLFVDIGGGFGHQSTGVRRRFPQISGRVILQDLEASLKHVKDLEGVEIMPYDFFTPQPVKGSRFYYLRMILHDYTDDDCLRILNNIIPAMDEHSRILIDDIVLPDTGAHWQATMEDISMMAVHAAKERTRREWEELLARAGLQIKELYTYIPILSNSVLVVEKILK